MLLGIQHIQIGAHADFLTQLACIQQTLTGLQRLLQRLHLCDAIHHAQISLARLQGDRTPGVFKVFLGAIIVGFGLAQFGLNCSALIQRQVELHTDDRAMTVAAKAKGTSAR